jgi:hypothetical protein
MGGMMSEPLPPLTQLVAFADFEDRRDPPKAGQQHICRWAANRIEALMAENARLQAALDEALMPEWLY